MGKVEFREHLPGEVIRNGKGTYVVEERIARGKFGYVFACRDAWGYPRVLRVLWPFARPYENVREKWAEQAAAMQRARHPGLVDLLDAFEHEGVFHLVLERCDYRLDHYMLSPTWDGARWLKAVARPLLSALDHIHAAGHTHRGLHPQNLFCTVPLERFHPDSLFSGAIKVGDCETTILLGNVDVLNTKLPRWLVPPEYLNPSVLGPMDHRVDVYQAGLLLLCVLQGRVTRFSFEEISVGLPAKNAEKLESGYGQVVARALQLNVADRYQSALELWQALCGEKGESR